MNHIEVTQLTL